MLEFPYNLKRGDTFNLRAGDKVYTQTAAGDTVLQDEDDAFDFVSDYTYPVTFKPGDTIQLLGRTVVTAQRKTFEDYRSMEWWCSTADGIPELGLFK